MLFYLRSLQYLKVTYYWKKYFLSFFLQNLDEGDEKLYTSITELRIDVDDIVKGEELCKSCLKNYAIFSKLI